MKALFISIALVILSISGYCQHRITGTIKEQQTQNALEGASIQLDGFVIGVSSKKDGTFSLQNISKGEHVLTVSYIGFNDYHITLNINNDSVLNIELIKAFYFTDAITISATRVNEKSGMSYSNISKAELEKVNTGRDLPYLLESVPSLVATSDAGTGIGYTGVRIRGSDASRINVTVNGIPINDSESQLLYWVNMPDLASSIDNIQVQRGVGSSTNGASAFGGSINIQTEQNKDKPFLTTSSSYGSFNTFKTNATIGTGLINDKWNFEGRLSKITSDGYIDRASSDLKSFHVSGGYYGKKDQLKLNVFSGKEVTYQSWYGVPETSLDTNRTWNYYTYDNQVDNYQQDHYQLFYTHEFNPNLFFNTALHYTYGRGYYEEFMSGELLSDYGLDDVIIANDTITNTDLIRRKWLDNDFYGIIWSLFYNPTSKSNFVLGGGYNQYDGDHFNEIIWAQYASNSSINERYYFDNGFKTDFNVFVKGTFSVFNKLSLFTDVQLRTINYEFTAPNINSILVAQTDNLLFFNPKAGITYSINDESYAYVSFSIGNKEPSRDDYTSSTTESRPKSERLYDFEAGYNIKKKTFKAGLNYYLMIYDNQLVLTGEVNDVGNYTRTNTKNSSRQGIELELSWSPFRKIIFKGNITLSKNKIDEYRDYIDDYDSGIQILTTYKNTDISFSPDITSYAALTGKLNKHLDVTLIGRYVGEQYLDNTSSSDRKIKAYFLNDFRINYSINPKFMKAIEFALGINNIFDIKYESNGYTFGYIVGGEKIQENYYYPQAGINGVVQVTLKF